jgi:hypothetical protein
VVCEKNSKPIIKTQLGEKSWWKINYKKNLFAKQEDGRSASWWKTKGESTLRVALPRPIQLT